MAEMTELQIAEIRERVLLAENDNLYEDIYRMNGVIGSLRSKLELIEERTEGQANELAREAIKYASEEIR